MRIVYRLSNNAVLAASTAIVAGVVVDPSAIDAYPLYSAFTDGTFILDNSLCPLDLQINATAYMVDDAITPTTVLKKYIAQVSLGASSLIADGSSSTTVTITIVDTSGTPITTGAYNIKVKATLGFIVDNVITTSSGVATTTLIAGKLTGDCGVLAFADDVDNSVLSSSAMLEITSSATITSPNTFVSPLTLTAVSAPADPGADLGVLYLKTGSSDLFFKAGVSGPEINISAGGGGSGTMTGPVSSTDTALVRWNGTAGTSVLDSTVTLDGSGNFSGINQLESLTSGNFTIANNGTGDIVVGTASGNIDLNSGDAVSISGPGSVSLSTGVIMSLTSPTASITLGDTPDAMLLQSNGGPFLLQIGGPGAQSGVIDLVHPTSGKFSLQRAEVEKFQFNTDGDNEYFHIESGYLKINDVPVDPVALTTLTDGALFKKAGSDGLWWATNGSETEITAIGGGDVVGPGASTDGALVRWDGTSGQLVKDGTIIQSDSGDLTEVKTITGQSAETLAIANLNNITITASGGSSLLNLSGDSVTIQDATGNNLIQLSDTYLRLTGDTSNDIEITAGTGKAIKTTGSIIPVTDSTYNLGATNRRFDHVYGNTFSSSNGNMVITTTSGSISVTPLANFTVTSGTSGTVTINGGTGGVVFNLATSTVIKTNKPIEPSADGGTSLGEANVNWSSVFSRQYDSKVGQDVTFKRGGSTLFTFTSAGVETTGDILPATDVTGSLGSLTNRFDKIYGSFVIAGVNTGITAAGTDQATATALTTSINDMGTVGSGTGVVLPTAIAGMEVSVYNHGGNALLIYPALGAQIDALGTNSPFTLSVGIINRLIAFSSTQWYSLF